MPIKIPILDSIKTIFYSLPEDLKKSLGIKTIFLLIIMSLPIAYFLATDSTDVKDIIISSGMGAIVLISLFAPILAIPIRYNLFISELGIDTDELKERNLLKFCLYYFLSGLFSIITGFISLIFLAKPDFIVPPYILHKERGREWYEILELYDKELLNIRIILIWAIFYLGVSVASLPLILIYYLFLILNLISLTYILLIAHIIIFATLHARLSLIVYSYFQNSDES